MSEISDKKKKFIFLLIPLLFAVTAFIIYLPSLNGDFVFDDHKIIKNNPLVNVSKLSQIINILPTTDTSRRIGMMSFALNYYWGGTNPFGYHLVNVIIHFLNGLVLFFLSYTILTLPLVAKEWRGNALTLSFFGSMLWLVHPIQTQAVSYIVQRVTSLATLFYLLSLYCYFKGRIHSSYKRLVLFVFSLFFGLLALGTKENTATLPFFVLLSEFLFFQQESFKMDKRRLCYLFLFGGTVILLAAIYLGSDFLSNMDLSYQKWGWTPLQRLLTELRVVVILYLGLLIYPHPPRLNVDHDFALSYSLFSPFTTFLSLVVICSLLALALILIKKNRLVSFALLWFFGNLVIESSIIPLELVFEHRLYLPSMTFFIMVIGLCFSLAKEKREKWVTLLVIPCILLLSYWTYERNSVWQGSLSLWGDAAKKSPNKPRPHIGLGNAYVDKGMLDEAIIEYEKALVIRPDYEEAHNNLGLIYEKKGELDKAISMYERALIANPSYAEAYYNLGILYEKRGNIEKAVSEYNKSLAINPNFAEAHNNLGQIYARKGMLEKAISEYKLALAINPLYGEAQTNLGTTYANKGMADEAISHLKKAITLNPDDARAYCNLGTAYIRKKMFDEAISECRNSLSLDPYYAKAYYNLGAAYGNKGMMDKSIANFKEAITINPHYAKAHYNLGIAYYSMRQFTLAIKHFDEAMELEYEIRPELLEALKPHR